MTAYYAPLRDISFTLQELAGLTDIAALPGCEDAAPDLVEAVLEEAARIASEVLAPINQQGDRQGVRLEDGTVRTADGWRDAYQTLIDGNWLGLPFAVADGGMGLPALVSAAVEEMWQSANMAFTLGPVLTQGTVDAILRNGSAEQKALYLPKLISGEWAGAMDLTEPQAGSDLAALRSRAVPKGGYYLITGQKIFISYGDHDLTDNIIHLVLARTPDAPAGIKGISLFIVPKMLTDAEGRIGAANDVRCVSLEHKLGIHGSPTAVMSFGDNGGAVGYLVGEENRGLEYMFVMMNHARMSVGIQGLGIAERAYQQARTYAAERVQGRPVGQDAPTPIHDHPDVRRMLMTMKAQIEAMRALVYDSAAALDRAHHHPDPAAREQWQRRAELLTPVVKGWCSETAVEIASLGVQVHGGMGYIEETGATQHLRDARITTIYEGTTAIQANDLVGRKVLRDEGRTIGSLIAEMRETATTLAAREDARLTVIGRALDKSVDALAAAVEWLIAAQPRDARLPLAAAVPFLKLAGIVIGGWHMGRAALAVEAGRQDRQFAEAKTVTAQFYASQVLPQAQSLLETITCGAETVMLLDDEQL